jgi:hypothetical protein
MAAAGAQHPLGVTRTEKLVRACRAAAPQRSAVHRQVGWLLDEHTTTRIRIAALWKQHPQLPARQILRRLVPGPFLTVPWVQKILRECGRACGRHTSRERLTGRRRHNRVRTRSSTRRS